MPHSYPRNHEVFTSKDNYVVFAGHGLKANKCGTTTVPDNTTFTLYAPLPEDLGGSHGATLKDVIGRHIDKGDFQKGFDLAKEKLSSYPRSFLQTEEVPNLILHAPYGLTLGGTPDGSTLVTASEGDVLLTLEELFARHKSKKYIHWSACNEKRTESFANFINNKPAWSNAFKSLGPIKYS